MDIEFSSDPSKLQLQTIHTYLATTSYWAQHIPFELFKKSTENSFVVGGYLATHQQVAFARVITDYATFGYLADVVVLPEFQGQRIGKQLMQFIFEQDFMLQLRRIMLATADAHGLYKQFGFSALSKPERIMELTRPNMYAEATINLED